MNLATMLQKENIKKYDCFVFMYHDQALIPFKLISKFNGVNFTGNLDVVRVSPDHGTAYQLKGSKNRSDKSIINCFKMVSKINKNRKSYEKSKKILLPIFLYTICNLFIQSRKMLPKIWRYLWTK